MKKWAFVLLVSALAAIAAASGAWAAPGALTAIPDWHSKYPQRPSNEYDRQAFRWRYRMDDVHSTSHSGVGGQWIIAAKPVATYTEANVLDAEMTWQERLNGVPSWTTRGNPMVENGTPRAIEAETNLVHQRGHVYTKDYGIGTTEARAVNYFHQPNPDDYRILPLQDIRYIFMVIPGTSANIWMNYGYRNPHTGYVNGLDVSLTGQAAYLSSKEGVGNSRDQSYIENKYRFNITKTRNPDGRLYGTAREYVTYHENPEGTSAPSQTHNVPLVIANVADGPASLNPLEIRNIIRNKTGDIEAYDHVQWTVESNYSDGDPNGWIFVPLNDYNPSGNPMDQANSASGDAYSYPVTTDVRNFCGLRYALQRYDEKWNSANPLSGIYDENNYLRYEEPVGYFMDLDADVYDMSLMYDSTINPKQIILDPLSHIAPGLITRYSKRYSATKGQQTLFGLYPVDRTVADAYPYRFRVNHPTIFGVELASNYDRINGMTGSKANRTNVTAFRYLPHTDSFMSDLMQTGHLAGGANENGFEATKVAMPEKGSGISLSGGAISYPTGADFPTVNAVAAVKVNVAIPQDLKYRSNDVEPIQRTVHMLPLHITFNIPRGSYYMKEELWTALLDQWKLYGGQFQDIFKTGFHLWMRFNDGRTEDITKILGSNYEQNVKVFMDEENDCITVSFIVMLIDSKKQEWVLVKDRQWDGKQQFLTIHDGHYYDDSGVRDDDHRDDHWDMTFYLRAESDIISGGGGGGGNEGRGGSGGGGCATGAAIAAVLGAAAVSVIRRKSR